MYAAAHMQHSHDLPSLYSYTHAVPLSLEKRVTHDYDDDNQRCEMPVKKRSRTMPEEEKDGLYFEKRARNNQSAKRSRDARRIREEQIQERVTFFQQENSRLARENQAIRYQISQMQAIYNGLAKPFE